MANNWKEYQEEAAAFFRSLGMEAATDVTIKGVRTDHDIDVVVRSKHIGFEILWLVECKYWKSPVSKLHVLGLREIVSEIGADRGILLSESGFQSGAIEAAKLTNVQVTSLEALSVATKNDIYAMRLRELFERTENCKDRYMDLNKDHRIATGLRPEVGQVGYSGKTVIDFCRELLSRAFRGILPFESPMEGLLIQEKTPLIFYSNEEVIKVVEPLIYDLENKLNTSFARLPNLE